MTDPAGRKANKSGKDLESTVRHILKLNGYAELSEGEKRMLVKGGADIIDFAHPKWFSEQVRRYRNLYGAVFAADFLLYNVHEFPDGLIIETKWQGSAGSVDEKYVFTVLSLKGVGIPSMVVLDGGGARAGAIDWIKKQQKAGKFTFKTLAGFMSWANDSL